MDFSGQAFEAGAFNPNFANEVVPGRIVADRSHFHFQSESLSLDIPLTRLCARLGEGEDDRIYFSDAENLEWEIFTNDERILDHPAITIGSNVRSQLSAEATRREVKRRWRALGYVVGVCALVIWLGQLAVSVMVRAVVARLPPRVEQEIGDSMMTDVRQELDLISDQDRVTSLRAVAEPLMRAVGGGTNFHFYIAEEPDPNAFALPGGHVIVTTGMLQLCQRPEQLLGVLSHELAHVTQKHGIRQAISAAGPFLIFRVFIGGNDRGLAGLVGQASDLLIRSSFSQGYEAEADEKGWATLVAARIDPRGMTESFEQLQSWERAKRLEEIPQAFASHPALEKRIARLQKRWSTVLVKDAFLDLKPLTRELRQAAGN